MTLAAKYSAIVAMSCLPYKGIEKKEQSKATYVNQRWESTTKGEKREVVFDVAKMQADDEEQKSGY